MKGQGIVERLKSVNVEFIDPDHAYYEHLNELVANYHSHLIEAKIALVYRLGWKEDKDGRLQLGQTKKTSDLDKEFSEYDFVIQINKEACQAFPKEKILALLDHELTFCQVELNGNDDPKQDERGRPIWRKRKADVVEFQEVIARHGFWHKDLVSFARSCIEANANPLLTIDDEVAA